MNHQPRTSSIGILTLLVCLLYPSAHQASGQAATPATLEQNKQLVRQFIEAQNSGNLDVYDTLLATDFVRHSTTTSGQGMQGREAYKTFLRGKLQAIPDFRGEIEFMVAEGNLVGVYGTVSGTQQAQDGPFPPTGKSFETRITGFFRIDGGRIAELWVEINMLDMLTQLGHVSAPNMGGE